MNPNLLIFNRLREECPRDATSNVECVERSAVRTTYMRKKRQLTDADILQMIAKIGADGRAFRFAEVREALRVSGDEKRRSSRIYHRLSELKRHRIVTELPGIGRRNKHMCVVDPGRLHNLIAAPSILESPAATAEAAVAAGNSGEIRGLHGSLEAVKEELRRLEATVKTLVDMWT